MRKWAIVLGLAAALTARGADVISQLEIDGKTYESVRWGPVNQGKVVVLHSRGSAFVAVDRLPEPYRSQFGGKPVGKPAGPVVEARGESAFERSQRQQREREAAAQREQERARTAEQAQWAVVDGKLVAKAELTPVIGFIRSRAETHDGEQTMLRGVVVELAQRRDPTKEIPAYMELRPGLWEATGERVFLEGYRGSTRIGELIRIWGREQPDRVEGMRIFTAAREATAAEAAGR